jgi:dehydrogenase/reductase SDR family protein 12
MRPTLRDRLLDATVAWSFDRSGFLRHQRGFDPRDLAVDLRGRRCVVTGAGAGLGLAAATDLARLGATVTLVCRDAARAEAAARAVLAECPGARVETAACDVADLASVRRFLAAEAPSRIDALVHNAGVLPLALERSAQGYERTWATHLAGPFALTAGLLPALRAATGARVITVTSGGMYPVRLDLDDWNWRRRPYDGVRAYAETKRAQVVLSAWWAEAVATTPAAADVTFTAMHPGWARTPGVERSLPRFDRLLRERLRSPVEGADTIVWLAAAERAAGPAAQGRLFFDRAAVPAHVLPWTRETAATRSLLVELLRAQVAPFVDLAGLPAAG